MCTIQSFSTTQIVCSLGQSAAGVCAVLVQITDQGYSNSFSSFSYDLTLTSLSNNQGSTAGGLSLTINGIGFDTNTSSTSVTICGRVCAITQAAYSTLTCIVNI